MVLYGHQYYNVQFTQLDISNLFDPYLESQMIFLFFLPNVKATENNAQSTDLCCSFCLESLLLL